MDQPIEQRRNHVDTFEGGDYTRDMEESPGLRAHFPQEDKSSPSANTVFRTEHQRKLRQMLTKK